MERIIQKTADGSFTLQDIATGITYHSLHGAIAESNHVFIDAGLSFYLQKHNLSTIHVLEMGFGTGLNAYLSYQWALNNNVNLYYETIEKFPLGETEIAAYADSSSFDRNYQNLHATQWNEWVNVDAHFHLFKHLGDLVSVPIQSNVDIVFYDAFAPTAQPELWSAEIFTKIAGCMKPQGVLVTYCSKGVVKRTLKSVGFEVYGLPGPPRKREMIRAILRK